MSKSQDSQIAILDFDSIGICNQISIPTSRWDISKRERDKAVSVPIHMPEEAFLAGGLRITEVKKRIKEKAWRSGMSSLMW